LPGSKKYPSPPMEGDQKFLNKQGFPKLKFRGIGAEERGEGWGRWIFFSGRTQSFIPIVLYKHFINRGWVG